MKQFTTKQQTDRLIELGYPKPNSIKSAKMGFFMGTIIPCIEKEFAYSIGELMELLPDDKYFMWLYPPYNHTLNREFIDTLYEVLVQTKKKE